MVQLRLNIVPNLVAKFKLNPMVKIWANLMLKLSGYI